VTTRVPFELPAPLTRDLTRLARAHETTVFAVLLAAVHTVLARHTGEYDAVLGAAPEPFADPVPVRVDARGDLTFTGLLARVTDALRAPPRAAAYRVAVTMACTGDGKLRGWLDQEDTPASLPRLLITFCAAAVRAPERPLRTIPLLDQAEQDRVLTGWRWPVTSSGPVRGFLDLFADRVADDPDRTAVMSGADSWTYRELDKVSNRIARTVSARGGGRDRVVAVAIERGMALLPVLVGVLKSGSVCLPLDPRDPVARLEFVLGDSGTRLLVREPGLLHGLGGRAALALDDELVSGASGTSLMSGPALADVACALYPAGAAVEPEGIVVRHRSLGNLLSTMAGLGLVRHADIVLAASHITTGPALVELLLPLAVGATVVLAGDAPALRELIDTHGVTVLHTTPATCRLLVESGWTGPPVRRVLCGGGPMPAGLASVLSERVPEVWHLYGTTETTVWSLAHRVTRGGAPPVGRPLANTTAYVLDDALRPVPPGVLGELYIGGAGLADGYLHHPELTAQRFIIDRHGNRLYRTSDLASYRPDGVFLVRQGITGR
jgi:amino acid adenylation domain-containing protein